MTEKNVQLQSLKTTYPWKDVSLIMQEAASGSITTLALCFSPILFIQQSSYMNFTLHGLLMQCLRVNFFSVFFDGKLCTQFQNLPQVPVLSYDLFLLHQLQFVNPSAMVPEPFISVFIILCTCILAKTGPHATTLFFQLQARMRH